MKQQTESFYHAIVLRVVTHLVTHLDESVDLAQLAQMAGLSPFHFHRVFRGMVGETPLELARRLRLERAAWSLQHSDHSVTRIAFDAGFETHEAFTRAFRAHFAHAPSAFRTRAHVRPLLAAANGIHFDPRGILPAFTPHRSGGHPMNVRIESRPALRVATVDHIGPYNQIGSAFERLGAIAGPAGLFTHPAARMLALYYDDPEGVAPEALRSEAGIAIPPDVPLPAGTHERLLDAGMYACTTHVGPFTQLGDAWSRFLGEGVPAQGARLREGPAIEVYLSDMRTTAPDQFETELVVPVETAVLA
jgi:AraC family transcriptional regulator